jgi:hypothetical protein
VVNAVKIVFVVVHFENFLLVQLVFFLFGFEMCELALNVLLRNFLCSFA